MCLLDDDSASVIEAGNAQMETKMFVSASPELTATQVALVQSRGWIEVSADLATIVGGIIGVTLLIIACLSLKQWKEQEKTKHRYQAALDLRIAAVELEAAIRGTWTQLAVALPLKYAVEAGMIKDTKSNDPLEVMDVFMNEKYLAYIRAKAIAEIYFGDQLDAALAIMSEEHAEVVVARQVILDALAGNPDKKRVEKKVARAAEIMVGGESLSAANKFDEILLKKLHSYYGTD